MPVAQTYRPLTADQLLARLDALGIAHGTVEHPPLYTVEESKALRGELPGAHVKNLFLKNKKGQMWLLTCLEDCELDLKALKTHLACGGLSFCNAERLMHYLGVTAGAVSPFGVINDIECAVQVLLDQALMDITPLNLHPLDNKKTTAISPTDLIRFLHDTGHVPQMLALDGINVVRD